MSTAYLVTGASKGLGKSIAIAIAKSGNPVIALARDSADLEEVGKQFDVTRERIRQIEAKALRKLRHPSRSSHLKSFLDD